MDFLSNSIFFPIIITGLLLLLGVLYICEQKHVKKYHPIGGTVLHLLINYYRLHHYITDLAEKYKTYRMMISLSHSYVLTSDPANVEYILKTNFQNYGKLKKEDILSRFVQINGNDPKYLRDVILNFVLAGKDPIAITMCWFVYELCKHPQVQNKVAKEIREAMNMNEEITNVAEFSARVSEATLEKMQYLHAALTETIRLYPALPVDPKMCFSDDVLPDGYSVKKGDMVTFAPYAMGKMKFIWGEDAHEFKPERWIDSNGRFRAESPYKFTAFQAGPHTCLGRDFAYRQLEIFSSLLLGFFIFKLSDENKVPRYKISINLHIDGPLQIRVFKRSGLHNS